MFIFVAMREEFEEAIKPLLEYLNKYHNPHTTVIVTNTGAEILTGLMSVEDTSFVED
jgi:hypothetical protein